MTPPRDAAPSVSCYIVGVNDSTWRQPVDQILCRRKKRPRPTSALPIKPSEPGSGTLPPIGDSVALMRPTPEVAVTEPPETVLLKLNDSVTEDPKLPLSVTLKF